MRALNLILILVILTTQSVWAINSTALYESDTEQAYAHAAEQHDETTESCTHFNHASTHFIGIFSIITFKIPDSNNRHTTSLKKLVSSISYQPPTPPPTL